MLTVMMVLSIANIIMDVVILTLPIPVCGPQGFLLFVVDRLFTEHAFMFFVACFT